MLSWTHLALFMHLKIKSPSKLLKNYLKLDFHCMPPQILCEIRCELNMKVKVAQVCPTLCDSMACLVYGILQARMLEWVGSSFSRGSSQPRSPALQVDSLPTEPQGKPKNTGVGSQSLLQRIFPTQESNQGLLHYRQILY